jgi:hypothetical protein
LNNTLFDLALGRAQAFFAFILPPEKQPYLLVRCVKEPEGFRKFLSGAKNLTADHGEIARE